MRLIVGLGNPGSEYQHTRHNVGYRVVDRIVQTLHATSVESTRWYNKFGGRFSDEKIICLYPLTYMNRSGIAVRDVVEQTNIEIQNIIVIYDDFYLPLGSIRIRTGGSAGGHNGMSSVIETMQTENIPRIRLGIFNETSFSKYADPADFVLSGFESDEDEAATTMIQNAHDAALMIVKEGIQKAMNSFNQVTEHFKSTSITKHRES